MPLISLATAEPLQARHDDTSDDILLVAVRTPSPTSNPSEQLSGASRINAERTIKGATAATSQVKLRSTVLESFFQSSEDAALNTVECGRPDPAIKVFTLPPQDKGFGAWSYVAAAFSMYIVIWGFQNAFPLFQTYLSSGDKGRHDDFVILPILAPGIQDILEGLFFQILPRLARYRRMLVIIGIATIIVAMMMASYATTAWQIVLFQGFLFGCSGIILNFVHVSIFIEWFTEEKQSQAMAIIWVGYRVGELAFPLICQWLLDSHGFDETLRVLIAPMLALLLPSIFLLRGRYLIAAEVITDTESTSGSKLAALMSPNVLFHLLVSLMLDMVINIPMMFITRVGADINLRTPDRALALSLYTLCNLVGTYVFGWLSDGSNYETLLAFCALSTSCAHLIWGFASTKFGLFAYSVAVGICSGGQDNCLYPFYTEISGNDGDIYRAIHSLFSFVGGFAVLSVGPIGVALLNHSPAVDLTLYGLGKYQYLIIYAAGTTMPAGTLLVVHIRLWK